MPKKQADAFLMQGPFDVELKVYVTDGASQAVVTYKMPRTQYPSRAEMEAGIAKAIKGVQKELGQKWRAMTKRELFDVMTQEATGTDMRFALPGGEAWDA